MPKSPEFSLSDDEPKQEAEQTKFENEAPKNNNPEIKWKNESPDIHWREEEPEIILEKDISVRLITLEEMYQKKLENEKLSKSERILVEEKKIEIVALREYFDIISERVQTGGINVKEVIKLDMASVEKMLAEGNMSKDEKDTLKKRIERGQRIISFKGLGPM